MNLFCSLFDVLPRALCRTFCFMTCWSRPSRLSSLSRDSRLFCFAHAQCCWSMRSRFAARFAAFTFTCWFGRWRCSRRCSRCSLAHLGPWTCSACQAPWAPSPCGPGGVPSTCLVLVLLVSVRSWWRPLSSLCFLRSWSSWRRRRRPSLASWLRAVLVSLLLALLGLRLLVASPAFIGPVLLVLLGLRLRAVLVA